MILHENSAYEIKYTANGMPNFFKDGERVKGKSLAEGLREQLLKTVDQIETGVDDKNKNTTNRSCIFCQGHADSGKFLNSKVIPLCREDYQTKTLGQVAQRVREINDNTE